MRHTFVWCASTSSGAPTDARNGSIVHGRNARSEEHTSELQSQSNLVCRLLLEKKKHLQEERSDVAEYVSDGPVSQPLVRQPLARTHGAAGAPAFDRHHSSVDEWSARAAALRQL